MSKNRPSVSQKFTYDGDNYLNYEVSGSEGTSVVFLHGFGASLRNWDDIRGAFPRDDFTLYLIDLKGFGLSSKPEDGKYAVSHQAAIIVQFLKSLSLERVALVGHSYGGGVALRIATGIDNLEDVPKIAKLVLVDPAAYPQDFPSFISFLRIPIINRILMTCTSPRFRARHSLKQTIFDRKKITDALVDRYATFLTEPGAAYSFIQVANQMVPKDQPEVALKYPLIDCPTLIVWGRNDSTISLENGKRLHGDIPDSVLHIIDNCGHVPQEECPEDTARIMLAFLQED